ncbi:MAG: tetratricopeptide repeat protein [Myxococcota bacterium]
MEIADPRVVELHQRLVEERDDRERARMHVELGQLAVKEGRLEQAARHFREALIFDRHSAPARHSLSELDGVGAVAHRRGFFGALIDRLKRKSNTH